MDRFVIISLYEQIEIYKRKDIDVNEYDDNYLPLWRNSK
jgi:hypothetical protein